MPKHAYVQLIKLSSIGAGHDYVPGHPEAFVGLPNGFSFTGYLVRDVKIGDCVIINIEGGVLDGNKFVSCPVQELTEDGFKTKNSVYILSAVRSH